MTRKGLIYREIKQATKFTVNQQYSIYLDVANHIYLDISNI